jgi:tRNA A-37 threonylcarbamoyl transferase component Bud32
MTLAAGTPIGKYVVRRKLAEGGMAEIYLAAALGPEGFEKDVVIKRVRPGLAGDPDFVRMFIAEARVASRLNHANLVHIFDFDKHEDTYYLAMEYVRGHSLWELRRRCQERGAGIPPMLVAQIGVEVARGLAYAHRLTENGQSLNLVHRDVTPHNVLLSFDGAVKLTDFGIAKAGGAATTSGHPEGQVRLHVPEQARGDAVDARTDVFALGVTLWELLTGARLFEGDGDVAVLRAVQERLIVPPRAAQPRRVGSARRRGGAGAGAGPGPPLAHRARARACAGGGGAGRRSLARGHRRGRVPPPDVPGGGRGGGGCSGPRLHPHLPVHLGACGDRVSAGHRRTGAGRATDGAADPGADPARTDRGAPRARARMAAGSGGAGRGRERRGHGARAPVRTGPAGALPGARHGGPRCRARTRGRPDRERGVPRRTAPGSRCRRRSHR